YAFEVGQQDGLVGIVGYARCVLNLEDVFTPVFLCYAVQLIVSIKQPEGTAVDHFGSFICRQFVMSGAFG
ncbi:hypothetical protein OFB99_27055, partial [Escherichia coli]|nr:hypothetical protein [Escherichia coli]